MRLRLPFVAVALLSGLVPASVLFAQPRITNTPPKIPVVGGAGGASTASAPPASAYTRPALPAAGRHVPLSGDARRRSPR